MIVYGGIVGLLLTLYTIYVERQQSKNKAYRAACDVSDSMSCSVVLKSPYAKLVGKTFGLKRKHPLNLPNTYYGVLFYIAIMLYSVYPFTLVPFREYLLFGASVSSLSVCVVLAYIMHFKLKNYCLVCIGTYFVNLFIFYYTLKENRII